MWSSTLSMSANSGPFHALLLTGLGPRGISMIDDPRSAFTCPFSTLTVLANCDQFRGLLLTVLGSPNDSHSRSTPRCPYVSVVNNPRFVRFWALSWTITHRFGVPKRFPWLSNPKECYVLVVNTRSLGRFSPVSWTILSFGVPK